MLIFWSAIIHQLPHADLQISLIRYYSEKQLLILQKAITNVVSLLGLVYLRIPLLQRKWKKKKISTVQNNYLLPFDDVLCKWYHLTVIGWIYL